MDVWCISKKKISSWSCEVLKGHTLRSQKIGSPITLLTWHHMSVMASQITNTSTVCSTPCFIQTGKETSKLRIVGLLLRESTVDRWPHTRDRVYTTGEIYGIVSQVTLTDIDLYKIITARTGCIIIRTCWYKNCLSIWDQAKMAQV